MCSFITGSRSPGGHCSFLGLEPRFLSGLDLPARFTVSGIHLSVFSLGGSETGRPVVSLNGECVSKESEPEFKVAEETDAKQMHGFQAFLFL